MTTEHLYTTRNDRDMHDLDDYAQEIMIEDGEEAPPYSEEYQDENFHDDDYDSENAQPSTANKQRYVHETDKIPK